MIDNFIYGFLKNKCKVKLPDFKIITGIMELDANTSEKALDNQVTMSSRAIDYPQGFNANNSVVISFGRKDGDNFGTSFGWTNHITSSEMLRGIVPMNVQLFGESTTEYANKILIQMGNMSTSAKTVEYKIVLMRLNLNVSKYDLGDINMDGEITESDLNLLKAYLNGESYFTDEEFKLADMNNDGKIDAMDMYLLIQKISNTE